MQAFGDAFINPIAHSLPKIPGAVMAFILGYLALLVMRAIIGGSLRVTRASRALIQIVMSIVNVFLWVLLIAVVLHSLGLGQIALALSGSLAIVGIAIGTGANTLVTDLIAGLFLAKDPDFHTGEKIKINDIEGEIEKIDIRKVRIRSKDNKLHIVPNATFDKSVWTVLDEVKK